VDLGRPPVWGGGHDLASDLLGAVVTMSKTAPASSPEDAAKAGVLDFCDRAAESGRAALSRLDSGEIEVRFLTGEVFLLGSSEITRIA
jgi:hypothetical protein